MLIAELFQTSVPNINLHLKAIYAERELTEAATIKSYLIVRTEGARQVSREVALEKGFKRNSGTEWLAAIRPTVAGGFSRLERHSPRLSLLSRAEC